MTVAELIETLKLYPSEYRVCLHAVYDLCCLTGGDIDDIYIQDLTDRTTGKDFTGVVLYTESK